MNLESTDELTKLKTDITSSCREYVTVGLILVTSDQFLHLLNKENKTNADCAFLSPIFAFQQHLFIIKPFSGKLSIKIHLFFPDFL